MPAAHNADRLTSATTPSAAGSAVPGEPARRIGSHRRVIDLDGSSLAAPGYARAQVRRVLDEWGTPAETVADVCLIVSELVTNAVIHNHPPAGGAEGICVVVAGKERAVTVAVFGPATAAPLRACLPDPDAEGGRGLAMVEAYADRWGYRECGGQRAMVWATVTTAG